MNRLQAFKAEQANKLTKPIMTKEESRLTTMETSLGIVGATSIPAALASGMVSPVMVAATGGVLTVGVLADAFLNAGKIRASIFNCLGSTGGSSSKKSPSYLEEKLGDVIDSGKAVMETALAQAKAMQKAAEAEATEILKRHNANLSQQEAHEGAPNTQVGQPATPVTVL